MPSSVMNSAFVLMLIKTFFETRKYRIFVRQQTHNLDGIQLSRIHVFHSMSSCRQSLPKDITIRSLPFRIVIRAFA